MEGLCYGNTVLDTCVV